MYNLHLTTMEILLFRYLRVSSLMGVEIYEIKYQVWTPTEG